jgi:uncharacterized protein (TIGR02118 family)
MIRTNVLYPSHDGMRFDFDYYLGHHIPMVKQRLTPFGLGAVTVDRGIGALPPAISPPYVCVCSLEFGSVQDMQRGLEEHGAEIMGDIQNYTDVHPVIQVSEVRL